MSERLMELLNSLKSQDETDRRYAIEDLADLGNLGAIPALIECLKDSSVAIREASVDALVKLGGPSVCEAVLPCLASENVSLRNDAREILERIGSPCFPHLIKSGLNSSNSDVRKFTLDIFSNIDLSKNELKTEIISAVVERLEDENQNNRIASIEALGHFQQKEVIPLLCQYLGESVWIQCAIIQSIQKIGGSEAKLALEKIDLKKLDPFAVEYMRKAIQEI